MCMVYCAKMNVTASIGHFRLESNSLSFSLVLSVITVLKYLSFFLPLPYSKSELRSFENLALEQEPEPLKFSRLVEPAKF